MSDVVSGATKGRSDICGYGHSIRYWNNSSDNREVELFAELFEGKAQNKESYNLIKKYLPKTTEIFEEILSKVKG